MKLLLVEDSERLRNTLARGLRALAFTVDTAVDGVEACGYLTAFHYDHVVLDLGLPRLDGMQVLRQLPMHRPRPRILVLSARDGITDRVAALNAGADDYLVKPFAFDELVARLHALARRPLDGHGDVLEYGALRLDPRARSCWVDDRPLDLAPREFALLELLLRHRGQVFSRAHILEYVTPGDSTASDRSIEVLVFGVRRKLAAAACSIVIENRRGAGYLIA